MLRSSLGYSWKDHIRNEDLYGSIPKATDKIRTRRLRIVGHLKRHPEEIAHNLAMWSPKQGKRSRGKPNTTFVQQLERDTGLSIEEMANQMMARDHWRSMVGRGTSSST